MARVRCDSPGCEVPPVIRPGAASLRCLVVDREEGDRRIVAEHLRRDPQVKEVFEANDGFDAAQLIDRYAPDMLFLDVSMPMLSGLLVVEHIGAEQLPPTVFMTHPDRRTIVSLETMALDYVLKPLSHDRLSVAISKLKDDMNDLRASHFRHRADKTAVVEAPLRYLDRFVIKTDERTELIRVTSVDCIESAGVYLSLHVGVRRLIYRASMQEVAANLDPRQFIRIHRSTIVNIDSILALEPISHGEFKVILTSGEHFRVSRTYRPLLEARLGQPL